MKKEKIYTYSDFAEFMSDKLFWSQDVCWEDCLFSLNGLEVEDLEQVDCKDSDLLSIISGDVIWDSDLPSNHILRKSVNSYYSLRDAFELWLEGRRSRSIVIAFDKSIDLDALSKHILQFDKSIEIKSNG